MILCSFRRCPYAIRARLALELANVNYKTIEIDLKSKDPDFLKISKKGTVPVLVLNDKIIVEQSIEIMLWAFQNHNLKHLMSYKKDKQIRLIEYIEQYFKKYLDAFKYCPKEKIFQKKQSRKKAAFYLIKLEKLQGENKFLYCSNAMLSDYAILPLIRQYFFSDFSYSKNQKFSYLYAWMERLFNSNLFLNSYEKKLKSQLSGIF